MKLVTCAALKHCTAWTSPDGQIFIRGLKAAFENWYMYGDTLPFCGGATSPASVKVGLKTAYGQTDPQVQSLSGSRATVSHY